MYPGPTIKDVGSRHLCTMGQQLKIPGTVTFIHNKSIDNHSAKNKKSIDNLLKKKKSIDKIKNK